MNGATLIAGLRRKGGYKKSDPFLRLANTYEYDTSELGDDNAPFNSNVYGHCFYYYKGTHERTYISWMTKPENGEEVNMPMICYFDHATKTFSASVELGLVHLNNGPDTHPIPVVIVADDGHIITVVENVHNSAFYVRRSVNPEDITSFNTRVPVGGLLAYPKLIKTNDGTLWLYGRYDQNNTRLYKSTDHGVSWTSMGMIDEIGSGTSERCYSHFPLQSGRDDITYLTSRRYDGTQSWTDYHYIKSDAGANIGKVFRNISGSVSRDVSVEGVIPEATLDASFRYQTAGGNTSGTSLKNQPSTISPTGRFFQVGMTAAQGFVLIYSNDENNGFVTKPVDIPVLAVPVDSNQQTPFQQILTYDDNHLEVWIKRLSSGKYVMERWVSSDRGDNWTFKEQLFPDNGFDYAVGLITGNFHGTNKVLFGCINKKGSDWSNFFFAEYSK